jgi:hypothetical protein
MRPLATICMAAAGLLLAGCGIRQAARDLTGTLAPDAVSLADRCADAMRRAIPSANIRVDNETSQNAGIDTMTAHVEGTRTEYPEDKEIVREVAVECRFDGQMLVDFHWTKGAPKR